MRISTIGAYRSGLSLMQQLQSALVRTQQQIASGRRILNPSDDPVSSARSLNLHDSISRLQQYDRNGTIAQSRLSHEESALVGVNDILQRVRELALQANNATQSNESRALIAIEMRQHVTQLVQIANQKGGNGRYLFSGNQDGTAPVSRAGNSFGYNGDEGQRLIQIGETRQIVDGDTGADAFFRIRNGNGVFSSVAASNNTGSGLLGPGSLTNPMQYDQGQYTVRFVAQDSYEVLDSAAAVIATGGFQSGDTIAFRGIQFSIDGQPDANDEFDISPSRFQDVFTTIQKLADSIDGTVTDDASRAAMHNGVNAGILGIDVALGKVLEIRVKIGSRLAAIDTQKDSNSEVVLIMQQTLSEIEDLDYAAAISRLSLQVTMLEAAQLSFVRTQNLSLFNYL